MNTNVKNWWISLVGALFFFYAFFQVNLMAPLGSHLLMDLKISSSELGILSACYFYGNVLFLLPAGLLLDRFSTKNLLLVNMGIAMGGTLIFALSSSLFFIALGRFLCGVMMSFGLIICLKLASQLLASQKMGLASSLIVMIGMFGGIVSQMPFSWMILTFGWRGALFGAVVLGAIISLILFMVVPSFKGKGKQSVQEGLSVFKSLKKVFSVPQNWYGGFFISLLNLPVAILGALFGITFLTKSYALSELNAASIVSMLFLGMIAGSPFFGWLSDRMQKRKPSMWIGSGFCLFFMILLLYVSIWNVPLLYLLFFCVGFTSASQVVGYPVIAESNEPEVSASALSLATIIIMGGGYGLGLPFVGWLIEKSSMASAMITIPIGILLSLLMVCLMKESYPQSCQTKEESPENSCC
jgi:predicted MFS family arabinose efflux permease